VCNTGSMLCGTNPVCTNVTRSNANCGGCGVQCEAGQACRDGVCGCHGNRVMCDGICVNVRNDPGNCGTCGNSCGGGHCAGGVCRN
jgi:hypothetical protein